MDINETLKRIRILCLELEEDDNDDTRKLAEYFLALDDWLARGGMLPEDWAENWTRMPTFPQEASSDLGELKP